MISLRRQDIQVLRGVSVLAVMLYHIDTESFKNGYLGVDIFFVISGFVITPLLIQILQSSGNQSPSNQFLLFWQRRFYRLFPALSATIILTIFLFIFFGEKSTFENLSKQSLGTIFGIANISAYHIEGNYFTASNNPLIHTWSLSVEIQIYLILTTLVAILLFLVSKKSYRISALNVAFSCMIFFSFLYFIFAQNYPQHNGVKDSNNFVFYSPFSRLWEFSVGGYLSVWGKQFSRLNSRFIFIFSIVINCAIIFVLLIPFQFESKFAVVFICTLTILSLKIATFHKIPKFINRLLFWTGERSYSLYLLHMPFFYLAKNSPLLHIQAYPNRILQSIIAFFFVLAIANIFFDQIENRFRSLYKFSNRKFFYRHFFSQLTLTFSVVLLFVLFSNSKFIKDNFWSADLKQTIENLNSDCKVLASDFRNSQFPCRFENTIESKSLFIIGDSTAAILAPPFIKNRFNSNLEIDVWTFPACPFVLNLQSLPINHRYPNLSPNCIKHNKGIEKYLKNFEPDYILFSDRGINSVYPDSEMARRKLNKIIFESLVSVIPPKSKLIVIGPTPKWIENKTVFQTWLGGIATIDPRPFTDNYWWVKATNRSRISYINAIEIFCADFRCPYILGDRLLYSDSQHLSSYGALLVYNKLKDFLFE